MRMLGGVAVLVAAAAAWLGAQAVDRHVVNAEAADRGKKIWAAECVACHGASARGTDNGPNLIRSILILRDRYGNELGPFLGKGHRAQSGTPSAAFTDEQIKDLAHFVHQRVNDTLRGSPIFEVQDVLTGDREAGFKYFNGDGKCATCHSPTGDLAGVGAKYDPATLQQRFLFPRSSRGRGGPPGKPVTVTVTPPSGAPVSGALVRIDDFNVSLRDAAGTYRAWKRTPGLKVEKHDPYVFHIELLDTITDKNMHDVVAYLARLK